MLRCLIADDEAPARSRLRRLLQPYEEAGRLTIAAEAADGVEALALLGSDDDDDATGGPTGAPDADATADPGTIDLAFLDVKMPGLDGFAVIERLDPTRRPDIVFTTAYHEFALRAFEENAVDYLLKPIARDRLDRSIARAEARHAQRRSDPARDERLTRLLDWLDTRGPASAPVARAAEPIEHLSVPHRDRLVVLPVASVVSVEVQDGITRVFALHDDRDARAPLRQFLVPHTLEHLEANLDAERFVRVHRSALVQLQHIREMVPWFSGRFKLILSGQHEVIASRERSRSLRERLMI